MNKCAKCNDKPVRFKGLCTNCYHANYRGGETIHQKLKERNLIRDGVGVLTGNKGEEYIVDADDFERASKYLWSNNGNGYARTNTIDGKNARTYLHRFILPDVKIVDHINRNRADNRKENLRNGEGINDLNKTQVENTYSNVRGVHKCRDKWQVRISSRENRVYLGSFDTVELAKSARDDYARQNNLSEFYN